MASLFRAPLPSGCCSASSKDSGLSRAEPLSGFLGKPVGDLNVGKLAMQLSRMSNSRLKISVSVEKTTASSREASKKLLKLTREYTESEKERLEERDQSFDHFEELKFRFRSFKRQNFLGNLVHYQDLAQSQSPKFMVIACADSRVCPSNILGFQPGEAFTVRNVANLVPPLLHGASETSAALEFAVNTLEVANILVVGHSRCGGIQALMSMNENVDSRSFIRDWVSIGNSARLSTKAAAGNLNFEMQCRHCEKESVNGSLLNLLTYPWIKKKVTEGKLSLHGGYYDFVNCTFEKWTLVYREGLEGGSKYAIKNRALWS